MPTGLDDNDLRCKLTPVFIMQEGFIISNLVAFFGHEHAFDGLSIRLLIRLLSVLFFTLPHRFIFMPSGSTSIVAFILKESRSQL